MDRLREAARAEQAAKVRFHSSSADLVKALAGGQIAAEVVDDGEGVAAETIAHPERALEVDGPDLVRPGGARRDGVGMLPPSAAPAVMDGTVTVEDVEDGAPGRPGPIGVPGTEALEDLAGSPSVPAVFLEDESNDLGWYLMRNKTGSATSVEQPARPFVTLSLEPLVPGVAADAIPQAELSHRPVVTVEVLREVMTFEHGIGLLPGHRLSSHRDRRSVTHVPGQLSPMYPVCTQQAG